MEAQAQPLKRLVEQAKADPAFFHALVFDPEKVLANLDYLDRPAKGALMAIDPEQFIGSAIGITPQRPCTVTCRESCTLTCGGISCGITSGAVA